MALTPVEKANSVFGILGDCLFYFIFSIFIILFDYKNLLFITYTVKPKTAVVGGRNIFPMDRIRSEKYKYLVRKKLE